jgi:PepSY-associated transmembrane protein
MAPAIVPWLTKAAIFVHRWLGVALCVVFLIWFPSGIGMMYWDYPSVSSADRLEHSPSLDPSQIRLSPEEAYAKVAEGPVPTPVRLNSFNSRPVYRFGGGPDAVVYADTGEEQVEVSPDLMLRVAAAWTGQPATAAQIQAIDEVDQWTVGGVYRYAPLRKYSWADGQQVYVAEGSGEVVQYTTTGSRLGAYVGAIPHWLYFTPLRRHGQQWSQVVIWTSGIGTVASLLGMAIGLWMYSPSKRYRVAGAATSIPYRGQKRWHTVFGLIFGLGAVTWAFSGLLSMDPFPTATGGPGGRRGQGAAIPQALSGKVDVAQYSAKSPREALAEISSLQVKELELASFAGEPIYLATLAGGDTHVVPVRGAARATFDPEQIIDIVTKAAGRGGLADIRVLDQYDAYYLDRRRERPLPVVLARLNDANETRYYVNPKTARIVGTYSARGWVNRWLYHGLHSLDFPWLYNYRPLWDIVVITFMVGGTALCVTSLILAWQVLGRTLRGFVRTSDAIQSASLADSSR